jgi:hypothetical protein
MRKFIIKKLKIVVMNFMALKIWPISICTQFASIDE